MMNYEDIGGAEENKSILIKSIVFIIRKEKDYLEVVW
jgi:hypothetical protein